MQLASGLTILDPEALLLGYAHRRYSLYDGVFVEHGDTLGPVEIALSIMINSQVSGNTAEAIWDVRSSINTDLAQIPDLDLATLSPEVAIPARAALSRVITTMCGVHRVKLSTTTKILHKKRPGLIPILDSVLERYYLPPIRTQVRSLTWGDYALALLASFHRDLSSVSNHLAAMQGQMEGNKTPLSACRILEILMWATLLPGYSEWFRQFATGGSSVA